MLRNVIFFYCMLVLYVIFNYIYCIIEWMYNVNIIVYKLFIFIKVNYIWIVGYVVGILLGKFENGI